MKKTLYILAIGLFLIVNFEVSAQKVTKKITVASVAGKTTGSITKAELIAAGKLTLNVTNKKIVSFKLKINNSIYSCPSGYLFNNEIKAAINAVNQTTEITFKEIKIVDLNNTNDYQDVIGDLKITLVP